jgi:hypothetical protein
LCRQQRKEIIIKVFMGLVLLLFLFSQKDKSVPSRRVATKNAETGQAEVEGFDLPPEAEELEMGGNPLLAIRQACRKVAAILELAA